MYKSFLSRWRKKKNFVETLYSPFLSFFFSFFFSFLFSSIKAPRLAYSLSGERTCTPLKDSEKSIILQQKAIKWHALKFANPRGRRGGGRNERPQGSEPVRDPYVKYRGGIRADGRILFRLVKILMRASGRDYLMTRVSPVHTKLARYIGWHAESGRPGEGRREEGEESGACRLSSGMRVLCGQHTVTKYNCMSSRDTRGYVLARAYGGRAFSFRNFEQMTGDRGGLTFSPPKSLPLPLPRLVRAGYALVSTYSDPSGKSKQVPHRSPFWITPKRERR